MTIVVKSKRVDFGRFQNCLDLEKYGIDPDTVAGAFFTEEKLLAAHQRAPEFHVVSFVRRELVHIANRFVPGWDTYYLSIGNADPTVEKSAPPANLSDVDELEKAMRIQGQGVISPIDRGLLTMLRGTLTGRVSLDGIVDRQHRQRVRAEEFARAQRRRGM